MCEEQIHKGPAHLSFPSCISPYEFPDSSIMASNTWEKHKAVILDLYSRGTLRDVVRQMKEKHNFSKTYAQPYSVAIRY